MTEPPQSTWDRVRERLTRERVVRILVTVLLVGACSYFFEEIKRQLPILATLQLQTFDWLSHLQYREGLEAPIIGVEIDDDTFYGHLHLTGAEDITDRKFLATVVQQAVKAHAAVIALDINLVADRLDSTDPQRKGSNRDLFEAFAAANQAGIPVVLTQGLDYKSKTPLPNISYCKNAAPDSKPCDKPLITIYDCQTAADEVPSDDPYHARAGFDLEPEDTRKVPLTVYTSNQRLCPSFALQVANAYDDVMNQGRLMSDKVANATETGQLFVYAGFVPDFHHREAASADDTQQALLDALNNQQAQNAPPGAEDPYRFPHVSALKVFYGDSKAVGELAHHIVLIGGHRHAACIPDAQHASKCTPGTDWLDYHPGPTGPMVGMYIHANYIRALLEHRYQLPYTRWQGVGIDVAIAAFVILIELLWVEHWWQRAFLLIIGGAVLVLVYRALSPLPHGRWIAIATDLVLAALIVLFAFRARERHRGVVVLLLAVLAVALIYVAQTLRGYAIDVLAVLVIVLVHHLYDYWREKKLEWKELTSKGHA
ncbi:MAG: CHASE2 domain-containing protein [Candidatus Korobacteraceae bacterium]